MEIVTWNFHENELKVTHRYDMILGDNRFSKINMDLCYSNNTIILEEGA